MTQETVTWKAKTQWQRLVTDGKAEDDWNTAKKLRKMHFDPRAT